MKYPNRFAWMLVIGSIAGASPRLSAQATSDDNQPGSRSMQPRRMSGLGGVKSQPGVKSAAPRGFSVPLRATPPVVHGPSNAPPRLPNTRPAMERPGMGRPAGGTWQGGGDGWHGYRPPVVSNGVTIAGWYHDDHFKLVFSTGGLDRAIVPNKGCIVPVYTGGCAAVAPYCGIGSYFSCGSNFALGYYYGDYSYDSSPAILGTPPTQAAAESIEPPAPPTPLEHAAALLKYGDAKAAVAAYQAYLKAHPTDSEAMRSLGLSLIDAGQTGDGVAVLGMAYRSDSTLAAIPFSADIFVRETRFRSNLGRVSAYANREKSASAWLTLATMMQAEGRAKQALVMVERARAAGLEEQVARELISALGASGDVSAR